jgi:Ca-activated chloride channel family protein
MTFASPAYLLLLILLIPVIGWYIWELHDQDASLQISSATSLARQKKSTRIYLLHVPFILRVAAITLLSIALARPQLSNRWSKESTEGIDIMMALDISGTMQAEDLKPGSSEPS